MKKILYTANTDQHINLCHRPYLKLLKEKGHIIHVATNTNVNIDYCDKKICIPITRTPYRISNIKAILDLKKVIEKEKYDLIITNTPMGAFVSRVASIHARVKYKTKVIYIAHGFHFYHGCNKLNYIFYYPVEKILSKYTDILITINEEDYNFARKHFKTDVRLIDGIGFDSKKFDNALTKIEKFELKQKLGIKDKDYVITYVAELSKRKRQAYLIKTLSNMDLKNTKVLLLGGSIIGNKIAKLIKKYRLEDNIKLLGFVSNVSDILDITDLVISVSKQEGLPLNIMEAMYKNKNILVTDCRGNRDLIKNNINGIVVPLNDKASLINGILKFKNNKFKLSISNKKISKKYNINKIIKYYEKVFDEILK